MLFPSFSISPSYWIWLLLFDIIVLVSSITTLLEETGTWFDNKSAGFLYALFLYFGLWYLNGFLNLLLQYDYRLFFQFQIPSLFCENHLWNFDSIFSNIPRILKLYKSKISIFTSLHTIFESFIILYNLLK